ncbi:MAG: extracellular solute-binding protein, partial [Alphaproteobacteria bacterium]|nr:extracellular solute-binding protein [Alphaproteobacteria bacterium]
QKAFKAKHGYDLGPPQTWEQYAQIGQFITDKYAPEIYGAGQFRGPAYGIWLFEERYRVEGGRFFDPETMKAQINNEIGVKVYEGMRNDNKFMPPGVETWGFVEALSAFLAGDIAMTISWPPFGRWAAGYGVDDEALSWVPKSTIADKVGYALPPGGTPQLAAGFSLSVSSNSKNKEAAYLFIQWLNSEEVSLQRVQLPYALRDPFRESHFTNKEYLGRWGDANKYLATLRSGADTGLLDLSILQIDKYEEALRQSVTRLWAGEDAKTILDDVAAQWDGLTEKIGVDKQKAAYKDWASKPNAYPK